jgi:hypothetical protein
MKKFRINEEEKTNILSMHKSLMNEQMENSTNTEDPNLTKLRNSIKVGCLSNGKLKRDVSKNIYFYRKPSVSGSGDVDFFSDMTYKFVDGSKSGKWKCEGLVTLANTESKQKLQQQQSTQSAADAQSKKQAYIDKFTAAPYNYKLNVSDIDKQKFTELDPVNDLKVPAGVFAPTDKFYSDPSVNKEIKGGDSGVFNDVLENQSINRNACRKNIEDYYKAYKRKNSIVIDGPTFDKAKRIVQACKDEHYGKWGVLGGGMTRGMNWDKVLDTMSGGSGGPLTYGEDSKWKLK